MKTQKNIISIIKSQELREGVKKCLFGFTLVELIVVIVILAILATIAFLSFVNYSESAKDSKRMSNVVLLANGFEVSISLGKYIDTAEIATTPNIVLSGSTVAYEGFYSTPIKPRLIKSLGLWGGDINEIGTEDYNKYKFTYVPSIQKYQVACILNSKSNFTTFDSFNNHLINTASAEKSGSGYIFLKGNYFSTGGVEGLIPKQEVWDTTPGEVKVIAGDKIVTNGVSNEPTNANCLFSGATILDGDSLLLYSENNIIWSASYSCTDRQLTRTCNNGVLSGDDSYKYSACVKGTPNNCGAGNYSNSGTQTYNLPSTLNHSLSYSGVTNIAITNGTKVYTADISCNDGVVNIINESLNGVCNTNYTWNSSTKTCNAGTQVVSCTGLPANAVWNSVSSITQTWNGTSWTPSVAGVYNTSSSSSSCVFKCNNGTTRNGSSCIAIGSTSTAPGLSCKDILTKGGSTGNGIYWIDPDGAGAGSPVQVYCDMINDGGGWTLVVRINGANKDHANPAAVGTLNAYNQSPAWKMSDTTINAIPKTVGYKLYCTGNVGGTPTTTQHIFDYRCVFGATTVANGSDSYCAPVGNPYHYALNMWPNEYVAYSSSSAGWYGCLLGYTTAGGEGRLWVK